MLKRFTKFIAENHLAAKGDRILLAVSGGIDSMVMAHLFLQSGYDCAIAHCNFTLRGAESDKDEEHVSKFAAGHKIQFFSVGFETKSYAHEKGISIQMAARELRYDWFEKIRSSSGFDSVAVAHNLNDNIETFLINLVRGTGIAGLSGMRPLAGHIIRPLLFATRSEITGYCKSHGIRFREDLSNADTKYLRNRIRHTMIPLLREINPSIEYSLNDTAAIMAGANEILSDNVDRIREEISCDKQAYISFDARLTGRYTGNRAVLYGLFRPFGIGHVPMNDLVSIITGKTGSQLFTPTHRIVKNRDELIVSKRSDEVQARWIIERPEDLGMVPAIESVQTVKITEEFKIPDSPQVTCVDCDKLTFPLLLRTWNHGDYFYPLGLTHRKKLSDYFTDKKYSLPAKDSSLLLESEGKVACILGDRIDNRFRITPSSENALIIKTRQNIQ